MRLTSGPKLTLASLEDLLALGGPLAERGASDGGGHEGGDEDALRCKVVALISDGEFDEAQKVLGHKRLEGQMHFERVRPDRGVDWGR